MGSKDRITAKLRTNDDFKAYGRTLDALGLRWSAHAPTGKGHPYLLIEHPGGREPLRFTIACSPRAHGSVERKLAHLRRALRNGGLIVNST